MVVSKDLRSEAKGEQCFDLHVSPAWQLEISMLTAGEEQRLSFLNKAAFLRLAAIGEEDAWLVSKLEDAAKRCETLAQLDALRIVPIEPPAGE